MKIKSRRKRKRLFFKNVKRSSWENHRLKEYLDNKSYTKKIIN